MTPACAGYVFVVGRDVLRRTARHGDGDRALLPTLAALSRTFGAAAWFCADAAGERHGWAIASAGLVVRACEFTGEQGAVADVGAVTAAETALGCFVDDPRDSSDDPIKWWPDDRLVRQLAAAWTCDPARLDGVAAEPACGWFGRW